MNSVAVKFSEKNNNKTMRLTLILGYYSDWNQFILLLFLCVYIYREQKLSSGNGVPPSSSSTHHSHISSSSKAQDKENKGRTSTNRTHHSTKSSLTSSSSKWNRRHPSTSSNGSSSAFVKPVMRVNHHGNSHTPLNAGGGLLRSREPTTASAWV